VLIKVADHLAGTVRLNGLHPNRNGGFQSAQLLVSAAAQIHHQVIG
jgi:hypothetical protein